MLKRGTGRYAILGILLPIVAIAQPQPAPAPDAAGSARNGAAAPAAKQPQDSLSDILTSGAQGGGGDQVDAPKPGASPAHDAGASPEPAGTPTTLPLDATPGPGKTEAAKRAPVQNRLVEEIVVTAQKREENIQDVPISIQAFTQEKLDVLGIQSVQDVQRATPGFTVTAAAGFNIVFLRGVGSDAFLPGVDSSVPFYLDGVPLLGIQGTADTLGRISRIEVLKGPQGTLFGRNSTGGAISIITPDPGQDLAGDVKLEYGNYDQRNVVAYANVPLGQTIAVNVSAFDNARDNVLVNDSTGGVYPVYARGGRVKLRWDALEALSVTLFGSYQENSSNGALGFQLTRPALPFAALLPAKKTFDWHVSLDSPFGTQNVAYMFGTTLNLKADAFDAKLIYAKQKIYSPRVDADFDGTSTHLADAHGAGFGGAKQFVRQDTAELQILSNDNTPFSEHLQWVAGLFYLSSLGGFDPIVFELAPDLLNVPAVSGFTQPLAQLVDQALGAAGLPPVLSPQGIQLANYGLIASRSYSGYAQGTYHVLDTVDFTAGVRYQQEVRQLSNSHTTLSLANGKELPLPFPQGDQDPLRPKQTSLRAAFQWRPFGADDQLYLSWARGWKNPTFNTVNLLGNLLGTMTPLEAERVDTAELGVKSRLLDGALQLNAAGFYTLQKNPLSSNVTIISGGIANFTNAQKAVIKGTDGDLLLVPLQEADPGLVITGGYSYLDAKYTEFFNGRGYDDATGLGFGDGGLSLPARNLSGKQIPRVPRWSYQAGISQRIDFGETNSLEFGGDTFFTSTIYFLPQNSQYSKREPVHLYNARTSYFYHPWNLELTAFCNNIGNKLYVDSAFVSDFGTALLANEDPRFYGLRAKLSF